MRLLTLLIAIVVAPQINVIAENPADGLSLVVADDVTASLLPPLAGDAKLCVLLRGDDEPEEVVHSRAFKLRLATHFIYRSESESPLSAIYRERLRNHGAVVIDLRGFAESELSLHFKLRDPLPTQPSGLSPTKLSLGH